MKKCLSALIVFLLIGGQATAELDLWEVETLLSPGEPIVDVARSWQGDEPAPREEFRFIDTKRFDMQMHVSMKEEFRIVNVKFVNPIEKDLIPERMNNWIKKVENTGGSVITCSISENRGLLGLLFSLISFIADMVSDYSMYKPAKEYHVAVFVDGDDVHGIAFLHKERFGDVACASGGEMALQEEAAEE